MNFITYQALQTSITHSTEVSGHVNAESGLFRYEFCLDFRFRLDLTSFVYLWSVAKNYFLPFISPLYKSVKTLHHRRFRRRWRKRAHNPPLSRSQRKPELKSKRIGFKWNKLWFLFYFTRRLLWFTSFFLFFFFFVHYFPCFTSAVKNMIFFRRHFRPSKKSIAVNIAILLVFLRLENTDSFA